jgi:hypothetical protein
LLQSLLFYHFANYLIAKRGVSHIRIYRIKIDNTALPYVMRYIIAPSSLAGRGLGVGFLYLIIVESAVSSTSGYKKFLI